MNVVTTDTRPQTLCWPTCRCSQQETWDIQLLLLFTASSHHYHLWLYVYNICLNLPSLSVLTNSAILLYDHHPHCLIQRVCQTLTPLIIAGVTTGQCWLPIQQAREVFPKWIKTWLHKQCVGRLWQTQSVTPYPPCHPFGLENKQKFWIEATPWSGTDDMDGTVTYTSRGRSDLPSHHPATLLLHTDNTCVRMTLNSFLQGVPKWTILTCTQSLSQCRGGLKVF